MALTIELARQWYPEDVVHGFDHILRVYKLAEVIGTAEGADMEIVLTAVLLHDVGGDQSKAQRNSHQHYASDFARRFLESEGWDDEKISSVQHCILAHRFRDESEEPGTIEAKVVFDADKLDAIGAVGVVRAIAYAVKDGAPLFEKPSKQFITTGVKADGEAHTPYHEYLFKLRKIKERMFTQTGRKIAEKRHHFMERFFTQLYREIDGLS